MSRSSASEAPLGDASASGPAPRARATVTIERELCKGCGFCIEFCPRHALETDPGFNAKGYHPPRLSHPEACIGCNLCGLYCPDFAIYGHALAAKDAASTAPAAKAKKEER